MIVDVAVLSDDQLVVQLATWSGRVAAGEAVVLRLLGELDAREAWAQSGALSCAHWAAWKLGLTRTTAREKVRVARCLRTLPLLTEQLSRGRVSYAQARAITRVATESDEGEWVELARHTTAAQLEKTTRGGDRCRQHPAPTELPPAASVSWSDDGFLLLQVRINPADAPGVQARLHAARAAEQTDRDGLYADLTARLTADLAADVAADVAGDVAAAPDASAEAPAPPFAAPYHYEEPPYPLLHERPDAFSPHSASETAALEQYWTEFRRR